MNDNIKLPEKLRELIGKPQVREIVINREKIDEENRTVEVAFSSEEPVERWFGMEILDHKKSSVRLDRLNSNAALLSDHNSRIQIGVVVEKTARIDGDKIGRALVRFSKSENNKEALKEWDDVRDGIRTKISFAYIVHSIVLEKEDKDKNIRTYRSYDWEPLEISLVSIPADDTVGVGRNTDDVDEKTKKYIDEKIKEANKKSEDITKTQIKTMEENMDTKEKETQKTPEEIMQAERERFKTISELAKRHNIPDEKVQEALDKGVSVEQFKGYIVDKMEGDKALDTPPTNLDMTEKEKKRYSLFKAIEFLHNPHKPEVAGFEIECSKAVEKNLGEAPRGLYIPYDIQVGKKVGILSGKKDMSATGVGSGAELVGTDHLAGSFIELLRNKMLLTRMGARYLTGLVGNVDIPKWTGASTYYWLANEGDPVTESTQTTGQILMSPHDGGASVDITRRLQLQSSPDAEMLVWDDVLQVCALALDLAGFHGTGANGQPLGIAGTTGIGAVDGTSYNFAKAVEHETDVDNANALAENFYYVTTPSIRGTLKSRQIVSGDSKMIVMDNMMNGYPIWTTKQIAAGYIFFGNFAQVIIGSWGVLDIYIVKKERTGTIILTALQSHDIAVRQPGAFSITNNFS